MRLIDADDFVNRMYHEAFEKDSDLQKWDSGCWIRYKLFENVLREQPTAQPDHNADVSKKVDVDDCISRQAAIDVLDVLCQEHRYKIPGKIETYSKYNEAWQDALDRAEVAIGNLSSVHPEIIRCKDCKHRHVENMVWTCPFGLPGGENFFCGYGTEPYKGE